MQLREVIETAGTCRTYRPDPVPEDALARALSAARFAPTGGNMQPVRFVVVVNPVVYPSRPSPDWPYPTNTSAVPRGTGSRNSG